MIKFIEFEDDDFAYKFHNVKDYNEYVRDYQSDYWGKSQLDKVNEETLKAFKLADKFGLGYDASSFGFATDWDSVEDFRDHFLDVMEDMGEMQSDGFEFVDFAKILAYYTGTKELFGTKPFDDDDIRSITGISFKDFDKIAVYGYESFIEDLD